MGESVAVVGSGGIGGFLAAELRAAGHEVALCVRSAVDRLIVESAGRTREVDVRVVTAPEQLPPVTWLFLTVKAQDVDGARGWLEAADRQGARIVVVQNGVDHGRVAEMLPGSTPVPAVIYCSVERVAPGRIVHHHAARLLVPEGEASAALAALFAGSVFEIAGDSDFTTASWRKLLSNVVWNPITALTLRRAGVLREPAVQELARGILAEAIAVARAEGAKLDAADGEKLLAGMGTGSSTGGSSMLYDRLAGRPLEHEHITGAVVSRAARHGIPAPLNGAILALSAAASGHPLDGSE